MSYRMSLSALVVLNGGCPIERSVFGGDARIVIGEVPDALELVLNFAGVSELADALNATRAEMETARADVNGHASGPAS